MELKSRKEILKEYEMCDAGERPHDHMYFGSNECGHIEYSDEHLPVVGLPGYRVQEANLILNGICQACGAE